ncbi:hypothetical protein Aeh1ORF171c [Aeromonas phage Aeh1]|uniref:Uncharacterized protein n=1 Tax=Aeromonas phage Aeh1 TaxID=2880362 RepID=Q76YQ9_9CAUD|nr:hypothetical protein Aeh1p182 [Aeromonas phage Aeh1]AAQ17837.1 hypothetical protein Aeh1ORF171c [Aeromonas phage Aeh1]
MKITKADIELQSRFADTANSNGFGTTQSKARCSNDQITRLLKLGLIKVCRGVHCIGQKDHGGFVRSGTDYCKA